MKEQMVNGKQYVVNSKGELIPAEGVKPIDALRDQTVEKIFDRLQDLRRRMEDAKFEAMADINEFVAIAGNEYGIKVGSIKGNLTLTSFDGNKRIMLAVGDSIDFTEGIHLAKQLIDEYLTDITKDSGADLRVLVGRAFRVKQGKLDVKRILELRNYEISDPRWKKAMDVIGDSIKISSSKQYFRLHTRSSADKPFSMFDLDFSTIN